MKYFGGGVVQTRLMKYLGYFGYFPKKSKDSVQFRSYSGRSDIGFGLHASVSVDLVVRRKPENITLGCRSQREAGACQG